MQRVIFPEATKDLAEFQAIRDAVTVPSLATMNLDYPAGPSHLIGFDTHMFTPIFVASCITGWNAHIMEQAASNSLIRPLSADNGVEQ